MFFSVIVPVYKVENYIHQCVQSVLNQTFGDFELILVDDGSPDACPQICDDYKAKDSRVKVIHKENGGLASARQAGIRHAEGDYVFNLDSDDTITLDGLEQAYHIIQKTNCDIVSFAYQWVENSLTIDVTDDGIEEGFYDRKAIESVVYPRLLMDKNMSHISYYLSGKAVRRTLLTPNQLAVNPSISLGEDLCCVLPCYMQAESVYISKKAVYLYTKRTDSLSKEFNAKQILLIENVIREISLLNFKMPTDFKEQIYRYSAFMCFAILAAAAEGNYRKSIQEIKDYIMHSVHFQNIQEAKFDCLTIKTRIGLFFVKHKKIHTAFNFLYICKLIKQRFKKG